MRGALLRRLPALGSAFALRGQVSDSRTGEERIAGDWRLLDLDAGELNVPRHGMDLRIKVEPGAAGAKTGPRLKLVWARR